MYDILTKMNLLEGRGSKPDFLDMDRDGNKTEPMKKAAADAKKKKDVAEGEHSQDAMRLNPDFKKVGAKPSIADKIRAGVKRVADVVAPGDEELIRRLEKSSGGKRPVKENQEGPVDLLAAVEQEISKPGRSTDNLRDVLNATFGSDNSPEFKKARAVIGKYLDLIDNASVGSKEDGIAPMRGGNIAQFIQDYDLADYLQNAAAMLDDIVGIGEGNRFTGNLAKARAAGKKQADLDGDGDMEPVRETDYSAKKARAGKDIGKPGKAFSKIAGDAAKRYGSKERGEKVAGAVLAKLRGKNESAKQTIKQHDEKLMNEDVIEEGFVDFMDRKAAYRTIGATVDGKSEDYVVTYKDGTRKRYQETPRGRRVTTLEPVERPDEVDADGEVVKRGRGRPKGTGRKIGTRGVTDVRKKRVKEGELEEDYDKDEYDEEGEMAMSQARTIEDAAEELQSILDADENLPEWVQKKIAMAKEYIDTARDYLKANRPEEEMMAEKAVSKSQRAAAGIAYAAKKGDIPKSELRGASKEMAKMPAGELKKFAKTKEKGLPEKKKEESVEETTVAGSVAPAAGAPKGKKGGMIFGKGVYEGQIAESFDAKLKTVLNEGMSINASIGEDGRKSITVTASDEDAEQLAAILKMAGLGSGYKSTCTACEQSPCGCESLEETELANAPDEEYADTDTMVNKLSGGLNRRKTSGQTTLPVIDLNPVRQGVSEAEETKLFNLYKQFKG